MESSTNLWRRFREFLEDHAEMVERRMILDRPWTHQDLHWGYDADGAPRLHGTEGGRPGGRGPTTRRGWCPCHRDPQDPAGLPSQRRTA